MSKTDWQRHNTETGTHDHATCAECAKRRATKRTNANRRMRDDAYRMAGLVRVHGALGGVYWE